MFIAPFEPLSTCIEDMEEKNYRQITVSFFDEKLFLPLKFIFSNFSTQIFPLKFNFSNLAAQIYLLKLCRSNFAAQILQLNICSSIFTLSGTRLVWAKNEHLENLLKLYCSTFMLQWSNQIDSSKKTYFLWTLLLLYWIAVFGENQFMANS